MMKNLPRDLTSYDFVKAYAVLLMVVDHIGMYFYPEELWLRVIGRLCVPVWFFLIGYARSRDIGPTMWGGAILLMATDVLTGANVFPLNILVTMMALRLVIDPVMAQAKKSPAHLWFVAGALFLLVIPTGLFVEYGTEGLIMALFGYVIRHREELPQIKSQLDYFMVFCFLAFCVVEYFAFGFSGAQFGVLFVGIFTVMAGLYHFKPATYPGLTARMPGPVRAGIQLLGRHSLEVYVFHLMLFGVVGMMVYPEDHGFLQWSWFSSTTGHETNG